MPLLKFNLRWNDDINVERDIEILHSHTFHDFHEAIKKSFIFPPTMEAVMYVSNDVWKKGQAISSVVEKNIRGAEALSMKRTPIGALLGQQYQKFIYSADHIKNWGLLIELISMNPDPTDVGPYPKTSREEGVSPATFGKQGAEKDSVTEIEDKFGINDIIQDEDVADLNIDNDLGVE